MCDNLKYRKNNFYGLTRHLSNSISKKISGEKVFSGPLWPLFIINFAVNQLKCKELRYTACHNTRKQFHNFCILNNLII